LIDFINDIAGKIEREHPDILIEAYVSLKVTPPAGVQRSVQVSVDRVVLVKPQPDEN
jgi:hypothetical protein